MLFAEVKLLTAKLNSFTEYTASLSAKKKLSTRLFIWSLCVCVRERGGQW